MGNQNTLINDQLINGTLEDDLQSIGTKKHKYLGNIQLWRKEQKGPPTIFSKLSSSAQRYDLNLNEHNDRKKVQHPNIMKYYGCQQNYLSFQGSSQQAKYFFEYVPNTLENVIKFHQTNCSFLEEEEIWKIAMQIISACSFLQKLDLYHGDLNPHSIFIESNKSIKILYHNAYPDLMTSYSKLIAYQDEKVFISPQQLNCLSQQQITPQDDPLKTDSFQLGLTLLELVTMKSVLENCIDYERKTIYFKSIMDLLGGARKRYSIELINLIKRLLTFDEKQRPTLSDILFDTDLQRGGKFIPQTKLVRGFTRGNTSPPIQPQRTNSPLPDMGWSSKSPVQREISGFSHILTTPLQRSVSPVLDRSRKFLSPAQSRQTTNISPINRTTTVKQVIIQTPINERGRKFITQMDNSRNVMVLSKSPVTIHTRKQSFQIPPPQSFNATTKTQLMSPFNHTQKEFFGNQIQTLKSSIVPQQMSQTLQQFVMPIKKESPSENMAITQVNQGKTPHKISQKGINLLSPLQSTNKQNQ